MKYFIISTPKSGTYLLANIFKNMKISTSNMHIWQNDYGLYNPKSNSFSHTTMDISESINLVKDNEFAVGHIQHNDKNVINLENFKKVLIVRDHLELWESAERFILETDRDVTPELNKENLLMIESWQNENIFVINFKDIINLNVEKINDLQIYLFNEIKFNSKEIIIKSLNNSSITKSLIRDGKHMPQVKNKN